MAALAVWFGTIIVILTAGIKRCHDLDQSGYWLFFYYVVPFAILILAFAKGTEGPNRFDIMRGPVVGGRENPSQRTSA
jgi:hypothetical protein